MTLDQASPLYIGAVALCALGLMHCGADDYDEGGASPTGAGTGGGTTTGGSGGSSAGAAGGSGGSGGSTPPPEMELESSFQSPVATGRFVWTANPDSGRVALVDAFDFQVTIVEAGFRPTYLAAVSKPEDSTDAAVVINEGSDDATLFRVSGSAVDTVTLPLHDGANAWALSPDGNWAVAWTDASKVENPDPTESFQDVTVIHLTPDAESAARMSVGYRPTRIFFDAEEQRVFAVTEPGISIIELDTELGPSIGPLVEVTEDPLENPASRDVTVLANGSHAIVRRDGSDEVRLVPLADEGELVTVTLSGAVTDLDVAADGSFAAAVVRGNSELVVLPLPDIVDEPTEFDVLQVESEFFGSVSLSDNGRTALLYTNATPNDHLTLVELSDDAGSYLTHRTVALKAPVRAVFPTAEGEHALALLDPAEGSTKAGAFSVVPTGSSALAPKIVGTDAPPLSVALAPDGSRAVVTVRDDTRNLQGFYLTRLPNLQVDYLPLASPPLASGIVAAADKGFISQLHPEGRLTFVGLQDGSARTLTGFELGAKVVD